MPKENYQTETTFFFDDLSCTGEEASLNDCMSNGFKNHNCDPFTEVAGLVCSGQPTDSPSSEAKHAQTMLTSQVSQVSKAPLG